MTQENTVAVTADELTKKIVELLNLKPGETFELALTRDGQVIVKKVVEPATTGSV